MISLYPYDQQWSSQFLAEKELLQSILENEVRIEHIGSTAIPGIYAKPEIELTYSLRPEYWGNGLAVEIGRYVIDHELPRLLLDHIVCFTTIQNKQSQHVMEKLGFEYQKDFIHANLPHRLYQLAC